MCKRVCAPDFRYQCTQSPEMNTHLCSHMLKCACILHYCSLEHITLPSKQAQFRPSWCFWNTTHYATHVRVAFRAVPINVRLLSVFGLSSKNSICCDLLRALDEVSCCVAWPVRPLRSGETTWGYGVGPFSLCWTLGLQSDRQSDCGSHFLIYNDSSQRQREWMRWF